MAEKNPLARSEFEAAAAESGGESLIGEFWSFLVQNKKWWLVPIVIIMLMLAAMMLLPAAATPFIYTLF